MKSSSNLVAFNMFMMKPHAPISRLSTRMPIESCPLRCRQRKPKNSLGKAAL
jgi:hypothetical protein